MGPSKGVIKGLQRDTGKENGKYRVRVLGFRVQGFRA